MNQEKRIKKIQIQHKSPLMPNFPRKSNNRVRERRRKNLFGARILPSPTLHVPGEELMEENDIDPFVTLFLESSVVEQFDMLEKLAVSLSENAAISDALYSPGFVAALVSLTEKLDGDEDAQTEITRIYWITANLCAHNVSLRHQLMDLVPFMIKGIFDTDTIVVFYAMWAFANYITSMHEESPEFWTNELVSRLLSFLRCGDQKLSRTATWTLANLLQSVLKSTYADDLKVNPADELVDEDILNQVFTALVDGSPELILEIGNLLCIVTTHCSPEALGSLLETDFLTNMHVLQNVDFPQEFDKISAYELLLKTIGNVLSGKDEYVHSIYEYDFFPFISRCFVSSNHVVRKTAAFVVCNFLAGEDTAIIADIVAEFPDLFDGIFLTTPTDDAIKTELAMLSGVFRQHEFLFESLLSDYDQVVSFFKSQFDTKDGTVLEYGLQLLHHILHRVTVDGIADDIIEYFALSGIEDVLDRLTGVGIERIERFSSQIMDEFFTSDE
ncbi:hypothetical protein PCE1_002351 [Barthelona sp. PCE]